MTEIDHLVVAARTLDEGARWCEATLGVAPDGGGRHALMSTHNCVLKIASDVAPRAYLEIIAIDPEAPLPGRARWFGLDDPALQAALERDGPQPLHWAAGTTNLDMLRWGLIAAGFDVGTTLQAERDTPTGLLRWRIVVRDDGRLLARGALPTLIEWHGAHPADALPARGIALQGLTLRGLPAQAAAVLQARGVRCEPADGPAIEALLQTPKGPVTLRSRP
jgi:hypothetical protein